MVGVENEGDLFHHASGLTKLLPVSLASDAEYVKVDEWFLLGSFSTLQRV